MLLLLSGEVVNIERRSTSAKLQTVNNPWPAVERTARLALRQFAVPTLPRTQQLHGMAM